MKKILTEWNEFLLLEKSISRMKQHIMNHDCAFVTAYRNDPTDFTKCMPSHSQNPDNKERNKELKAVLLEKGYGVTSVMGSYIEGFKTDAAKEVKEHSFFVVNLNDDEGFRDEIFKLSEFYCQDSFLFVNRGGQETSLVGTNKDEFPGYGKEAAQGHFIGGEEAEFMSRVGQRPIHFQEGLETKSGKQNNTKYLISTLAKKVMQEMKEGS
ncbi:MAG: hypothetical protein NWE77_04335 [Candidatus Bathyarchaeota archaeon]|jgi:hypothetical protein|nr:hypothetical protein [Candidatus Bathyarchaeota archaeon]